jgi:hypothetical protein
MTGPIDAITAVHNAFRHDMADIDAAALELARGSARDTAPLKTTVARYRYFSEVLDIHARGEELAIFPALDKVAPLVSEAYEKDHRGLDAACAALDEAVAAGDALATARASAALKFHLDIHLDKEDSHLYRIVKERVSAPDQGKAVGILAAEIPQDRFPQFIAWLFPLIGDEDRENMLRIQQMVLPAEAFAGLTQLVQTAIGDDWTRLSRRMPDLAA